MSNYKEAVNSIYFDEYVSFLFQYWIFTNNQNNNYRKLLKKGPNYRESQTIYFSRALIEITAAPDTCIEAMTVKPTNTISNFEPWKEEVLAKVKEKITEVKQKITYKQTKY